MRTPSSIEIEDLINYFYGLGLYQLLHDILKGLSILVYINTKHHRLKQYNSSLGLDIKSCHTSGEGIRLSFRWSAFDIKKIVKKKMVTTSFGEAAACREWTPDTAPRKDSWHFYYTALVRSKLSPTWCIGGPALAWGKLERHLTLGSQQKARLTCHIIVQFTSSNF